MTELLGELRVVLPGAQVLLAFLFTVPFATHFDQVGRGGRIVFFVCLVLTSLATVLRAWNTRIEGSKGEPTSRRRDHVEDR